MSKQTKQNATYLTEKYPSKETELWTPCIYEFFRYHNPELPISACIKNPSPNGPWYETRQQSPIIIIDGKVLMESGPDDFLPKIGEIYGINLIDDPGRRTERGDIAGIYSDLIVIKSNKKGVYIIENKPYDGSEFDGNQGPGGAYIDFIKWLNAKGVKCEYLVIHSIGCKYKLYLQTKHIYEVELPGYFGILLLEDIFMKMAKEKFTYPGIMEDWSDFTYKGDDFA